MKKILTLVSLSAVLICQASGVILLFDNFDIVIPEDFSGVYIDIDNGTTSTSEFSGWDVNFFFGGVGIANSDDFQPVRTGTGNLDPVKKLAFDDVVSSGTQSFSTGFGGSDSHLGDGSDQFAVGASNYLAFNFTPNGESTTYYGWMEVTLTNNVSGGIIHRWAYENTEDSIIVGAVPEPSKAAFYLGCIATFFVFGRRRQSSIDRKKV